jgi:hypothetical protein
MSIGSKKRRSNPRFGPEVDSHFEDLSISKGRLASHLDKVSVSLRYYQSKCECFSEWTRQELKSFSQTVHKVRGYSRKLLCGKENLCEPHKGEPKRERFSRPQGVSPDQNFWEIKVDQSNKLRMHGFFVEEVFFLVWLDREHECFPYHKN